MILFTNDGSVKMAEYKDFVTKIRFKRWVRYLLPGLLFLALMPLFLIIAMKWLNPAKSSYMLQRLAAGREIRSQWTPLAEISPYMVLAVLAAEDIHFTRHNGFDFRQIRRAFVHNRLQRTSIGASTISQQVAKNLFLWPGKSYLRKALEGYLTILIELFWSKRRILEVYLNIAEMGPDLFGVGTASELYFRKSPSVLTPEEAASIAVALPNPGEYAVTHLPADLEEHKDKVLQTVLYLERIKYLKNF
jgi:monofunctional biosynthetic peptidoglycan transglycosylase